MSKEFKTRVIQLAEEAVKEIDAFEDNVEAKRNLVNWLANFWTHAAQGLASYSVANGEIKPLALLGVKNALENMKKNL